MEGGTGRSKNGQRQQRRERRLTIDIRQIQGIYTPKTAWQKGMVDRHPLLCVYSVFVGLILRDGVQIRLNVAVQNEVCISQRVVVDEIVQLRPLEEVVRHLVLHGGAVDGANAHVR